MRLIFKKSLNFPSSSFAGLTFKFPPGFQAVAVIYTWNFCSWQKHWEDHRTKIWNNFAYPTTFFLSFSFIFLLSFLSFFLLSHTLSLLLSLSLSFFLSFCKFIMYEFESGCSFRSLHIFEVLLKLFFNFKKKWFE